MGKRDEPRLCPDCPRISFLSMVKPRSYTRTPPLTSNVKLCAKLRALNVTPKCPHFSIAERINGWFGKRKRRRKRRKKK